MSYKKFIFSILLFISCSANAVQPNDQDKRIFLKRWYDAYEKYIFENGSTMSAVYLLCKGIAIPTAAIAIFCKILIVIDEKKVAKDPTKLAELSKCICYSLAKNCYQVFRPISVICLVPMVFIQIPFIRQGHNYL